MSMELFSLLTQLTFLVVVYAEMSRSVKKLTGLVAATFTPLTAEG